MAVSTVRELFDLTGAVALVTGAGAGLGAVFAQALAEAGADVACADRDARGAEQTAAQVRAAGRQACVIHADVTVDTQVEAMVAQTVAELGQLDVVVNNAGVVEEEGLLELSREEWQRVLDVNLTGVFLCAQAAARAMVAAGAGGRIINIASILGAGVSQPGAHPAYAATKGAVINLTRDLAVHLAPHGITVTALGPAYFPSTMTQDALADADFLEEVKRRTPLGRPGRLDELKGPVVFLASAASSYVTGQTLFVDGGWTAW